MNNSEKMLYLSSKLMMLSMDREHNTKEIETVSEELAALQRQMENDRALSDSDENEEPCGFLKFSIKEILKMPKHFRTKFRLQGCTAHVRKRTTGRYKCSYEIRYNRCGYHISVSATTLAQAKVRFIEKINNTVPNTIGFTLTIPNNFDKFSTYWFENFHKRKVQPKTYKNNVNLYNRHIKEKLKNYSLQAVTPAMAQELLESLPGNGKTADDAHSILNQIFDTAVSHAKLKINPLDLFVHTPHEKESGIELTRTEELMLINAYNGTVYGIIYPIMLYAGLRPNEYKTARIEGDFIVAQ